MDLNSGLIKTLAGKTSLHWGEELTGFKPVCGGWKTALPDGPFHWPTDLSVNPVDDEVYVLDGGNVFSVSLDGNVRMNCINLDR